MKHRPHGIFCLEGDWWNDFNRSSTVKPVLELLAQGIDISIPTVHRDVATREELAHYLGRWRQRGVSKYSILYLAFHGDPNCIYLSDRRRTDSTVTLEALAGMLQGVPSGRMVHFGSCGTMATHGARLQRFLRATGLVAATGFKSSVDWLTSSVFDVLLFEACFRHAFTRAGARAINQVMVKEHRAMARSLDFRMVVRNSA